MMGMHTKYESGEYPKHIQQVVDLEKVFAKALKVAPATANE